MATAKKAAKKAGKTAVKKSAGAKRGSRSKTTPAVGKAAAQRSPRRTRDGNPPIPPLWIPGTLGIVDGKLGLQTDLGFIPLEDVATYGQAVGLVFQPASGEKGEALRVR